MAEFFKFAPVSSAAYKAERPINISCNHLTTLDFYTLNVSYHRMLDPGERISVDTSVYCKLNPMQKPLLGNCRIVSRAFFVPYYQVMKFANEFFTQTLIHDNVTDTDYIQKRCPFTNMVELAEMFTNSVFSDEVSTEDPCDFICCLSSTPRRYVYTRRGRAVKSVLEGLGYKVVFPQEEGDYDFMKGQNLYISVLPLLAFAKVFYDWFANRSYANVDQIYQQFLKNPNVEGIFYDHNDLIYLLQDSVFALFESDYFTSQFDRPTAPNESAAIPNVRIPDVLVHDMNGQVPSNNRYGISDVTQDSNGTPVLHGTVGGSLPISFTSQAPYALSQYILDSLKTATDLVQARQYSGNKIIDNFLIQFGYKSPFENAMQSQVLGHFDTYINIGEVTATTENASANQVLGDFAGRASGSSRGNKISFEAHDKGSFFIISYVEAQTGYVQGMQRYLFDTAPNDFYNGRFDGKGPQATYVAELFAEQTGLSSPSGYTVCPYSVRYGNQRMDSIYGFMPRYSHLKIGYDVMSGEFSRGMYYDANQVWHLFRDFRDMIGLSPGTVPVHDLDITMGYFNNFNRVFAITDKSIDNFQTDFYFNVRLYTNKLPLWQSYEFDHEDEHKKIMQQINGSKVN